ncbi:MAG: GMC family oxidoreductase N-terminal domain-containing protein [Gemmatimonadota bacterium]|nr:GMC family oxidoreductase N-terminal domain-containing protein [Gemmatimonadota bacterium]
MLPLSLPNNRIRDVYDVIVVGSGYGGGISASRMARAGKKVCVLERGKEFLPGDFPDESVEALRELQTNSAIGYTGGRTDLFDFNLNEDINVLVGCGLGGTSLINANVSLKAEDRVFEDPVWPDEIRQDGLIRQGYERAMAMLLPRPYPEDAPELPKLQALEASAQAMGARFARPPINVNFDVDGPNHVGVAQQPCQCCGDCVTGCNYRAKNTTQMNYLPDARNHGAEIFARTAVRYVERQEDGWLVHYQLVESAREKFDAPDMTVRAGVVVLSAGTLGSTEILLRSKQQGLSTSNMLGKRFSGNGDVLGFAYNTDRQINSIGYGDKKPGTIDPVGPCITGVIDLRGQDNLNDGMIIEEGVIPGALSVTLPLAFAVQAKLVGKDTAKTWADDARQFARETESLIRGAYEGALNNTQVYLVMTHDDANGEMYLQDDRLRIKWPGVGKQEIFKKVNENLNKVTEAHNGIFVKNLLWSEFFGHDLVTVHPLGGCVMGREARRGVVNHKGQVFCSSDGIQVHEGLYVTDGSVIPRAVGVNPLLTISAISERCCTLIAMDRDWKYDVDLPSAPKQPVIQDKVGIQFTETMKGYFSTRVKDDFKDAYNRGKEDNSEFQFILTIQTDDMEHMIADDHHPARMLGSVIAPALSDEPLTVTDGYFNLFVDHPDEPGTKNMKYRMKLTSETGDRFYFYGYKVLRDDFGLDMWSDTTTLYISVWQGEDDQGELIGKGILRIKPEDFMKQLTTMKATNAGSVADALKATARFGAFFTRVLYRTYGFAQEDSKEPSRQHKETTSRENAVSNYRETIVPFTARDQFEGNLIHVEGLQRPSKGPVLLVHGAGVRANIFRAPVETTLVQCLIDHGYDVWLENWRASSDIDRNPWTLDQAAAYDHPAAVETVVEATGSEQVKAIIHCVGSTSFMMSAVAGLIPQVTTIVANGVALHPIVPAWSSFKLNMALPMLKVATSYLNPQWGLEAPTLVAKLIRFFVNLTHHECNNPVCKQVSFTYGSGYPALWRHENLNDATHEWLKNEFGNVPLRFFQQMARSVRQGNVISVEGFDELPADFCAQEPQTDARVAFLTGRLNRCFLYESQVKSFEWFDGYRKNYHTLHLFPTYSHLDVFMGKNADRDTYPTILQELDG